MFGQPAETRTTSWLNLEGVDKKTKEVYKSSTIPLKNKVKRKELETRFNELDEVKPAEHTYKKTAYVDDTEEINEVKKLKE